METDARRSESRQVFAEWMLVATTACWGISFPLLKDWTDAGQGRIIGPGIAYFTLMAMRMPLAMLILGLIRPSLTWKATGREHAVGLFLGGVTFVASAFQGLGLAWTTPADSAFITSLSSVWVPLFAWLVFRIRVPILTIAGLGLGMAGTFVLSIRVMDQAHWGYGETLTVASTLGFAVQILLLDRLGRTVNSSHITMAYFAMYGLGSAIAAGALAMGGPGIPACIDTTWEMLNDPALLRALLVLAVFCTVMAFHWMNTYQPFTSASRAALIYLLEPLWAALFSLMLGHDKINIYLIAGGALILAGNLLAEIPRWRRDRARARAEMTISGNMPP